MSGIDDTCVLRACGLRKQYGREGGLVRAVDGVDLDVAAGQTLAVMGPSGCGKSTLLHLLGGLDRPTAGELFFEDRRVDQLPERALAQLRRKEIGFVFQAFQLLDELTAQENVELPALLARSSPRQARRRARRLLEQVGLAERASHLPSALSGGQRQRVATLARALVNEPAVILADEPTGNLDSAATLGVLRLFGALHAEGLTLVVVTHDDRVAATADRLISMRDGAFVEDTRMASIGGPAIHFPARLDGWRVMGPFVLVWRLAAHDLRRRLAQSVLLLLVIAAATSTLALAFAFDGTSSTAWGTTRATTAGPDVMAEAYPARHPALGELTALTRAPGVVAMSGPYPMASPVLRTGKIADPGPWPRCWRSAGSRWWRVL